MKNVLEWLEKSADIFPDKIAYQDIKNQISFKEVLNISKKIASALLEIADKTPIAVISGRELQTINAYLGVIYSGHAYAPIDGTLPDQRLKLILEILNPKAIVLSEEFYEKVKSFNTGAKIFKLEKISNSKINENQLQEIRRNMVKTDPLYVIFTSGSTGKPKGVITSHESLICYIESYAKVMEINQNDILGNQSPLDYIAAIRDIYLPLFKSAKSVIIPKEFFMQPNSLFDFLNKNKVSAVGWSVSAFTVPYSLNIFKENSLNTLEKICFSGSIMPMNCLKVWMKNLPNTKFVNQYGPTEATASCTYYEVTKEDLEKKSLPIGKPYENYRIYILDDNLKEVEDGQIGQICIQGPILALGYYKDLERTKKDFILNPNNPFYPERIYKTGDYGLINENGFIEFKGRMDRQIKHMGHRIELDEIEFACDKIDGVQECLSLYDYKKEKLHLFYSGNIEKRELSLKLKSLLPLFMLPRKIEKLEEMPKLPNGKIDINTLKGKIK